MAITKLLWKYTVPETEGFFCSLHTTSQYIAAGLSQGHVKVMDYNGNVLQTPHVFYPLPDGRVQEVMWMESCNNLTTVSTFRSGQLDLWDLPKGKHVLSVSGHAKGIPKSVYIESLNTLVTCSYDHTTRIWDLTNSGEATNKHILEGHVSHVQFLAVYKDRMVISASIDGDVTARAWDIHTGTLLYQFPGQTAHICSLRVINDFLILGLRDGTIAIWSLLNGEKVAILKVDQEAGIHKLDKMGDYLVTGDHKGYVHIWDLTTFQVIKKTQMFAKPISEIAIHNHVIFAAGGYGNNPSNSCGVDHGISIWRPWDESADQVVMFEGPISGTYQMVVTENKLIAGMLERGRNVLKVWELSTE